ncbi:hypothetical protein KEM60_02957 [Austwickia sp. TVS 96-490-7B]|nr:hypothetical protein [Austwickia sp. TVS 96-490-7B]
MGGGGGAGAGEKERELRRRKEYLMESDDLWGTPKYAVPPVLGDEGALYVFDDDEDDDPRRGR